MKKRLLAALLSAVLLTTGTLPAFAEQDTARIEQEIVIEDDDAVSVTETQPEDTASESEQSTSADSDAEDIQTIDVEESDAAGHTETEYAVNPLYADTVGERDLLDPQDVPASSRWSARSAVEGIDTYTEDETVIAQLIRDAMRDHSETVVFKAVTPEFNNDTWFSYVKQWVALALEETDSPIEGDYIRWNYAGFSGKMSYHISDTTKKCEGTYTLTFTYYTTPEQEAELTTKVNGLLNSFAFTDSTSDYTKIQTIYDYVCRHVTYDNANLNDDSYKLKYTAYAALINGTAVCQGYSSLIYRMMKQENINSRIIASTTHGWNIVQLKGKYYYLDATWDSNTPNAWNYFLCGEQCTTFFSSSSHIRSDGSTAPANAIALDYTSSEFYSAYPMSEKDYVFFRWTQAESGSYSCTAIFGNREVLCTITDTISKPATCVENASVTYSASGNWHGTSLHSEQTFSLPNTATGIHSFTTYTYNDDASCTIDGTETAHCDNDGCDATDTRTKEGTAFGHTKEYDVTIINPPTCRLSGMKVYRCKTCGVNLKYQTIPATGNHTYKSTTTKAKPGANGKIVNKCTVCGDIKSTTVIYAPKTLTLSATSYTYNGAVQTPTVTVKDSKGTTIAASNYIVSYASGRKNIGTYKVTVTFQGSEYSGSLSTTYTITPKSISGMTATLSTTSYTYSNSAKKPTVTLKNGTTKLKSGSDYTVTYSNNKNVGKATVKLTGKGNYSGTKTLTFKINPKATTLKSVTASSKGFTAKWTKLTTQASGYLLQYSTSSKFTNAKTVTITSNKTVYKKVTKLTAKKKYYVRVRTYKTVSGTKYYSAWSKAKTVTTKK